MDFDFIIAEIMANTASSALNAYRDILIRFADDGLFDLLHQRPFTVNLEVGRGYELLLAVDILHSTVVRADREIPNCADGGWAARLVMLDWQPPHGVYRDGDPADERQQRSLLHGDGTRTWHVAECAFGHLLLRPGQLNSSLISVGQVIYWVPETFVIVAYVAESQDAQG